MPRRENGLTDRQPADASDRAVDAGLILIGVRTIAFSTSGEALAESGSRFTIEHRVSRIVTLIAGSVIPLTEREHTAQPLVLRERNRSQQANDDIRAKSSHVEAPSHESSDLAHSVDGDHRDARFIEDAMLDSALSAREHRADVRPPLPSHLRTPASRRHPACEHAWEVLPEHRLHGGVGQTGAGREACLPLATESRCGHRFAGTPDACHHRGRASPASRLRVVRRPWTSLDIGRSPRRVRFPSQAFLIAFQCFSRSAISSTRFRSSGPSRVLMSSVSARQ